MARQFRRIIHRICVNKSSVSNSSTRARSYSSGTFHILPVDLGAGEVIASCVLAAWSGYWFDMNGWRTAQKAKADALRRRNLKSIKANLEAMQRAEEEKGSKVAV